MRILVDHGSTHNLGDTAMLEGVVGRLVEVAPDCRVEVLSRPGLTTSLWDWPSVRKGTLHLVQPRVPPGFLRETRFLWRYNGKLDRHLTGWYLDRLPRSLPPRAIRVRDEEGEWSLEDWCGRFDGYLVAGGGNLTDTFLLELWQRCCLIQAFAEQGKPVVLGGQQIGPWRSRTSRRAVARALRRARFVGLREPTDSLAFCREEGLDPARYAVIGDDSFGVPAASPEEVEAVLGRHGIERGRFLAVNVRLADYVLTSGDHLTALAGMIRALHQRFGLPLLVVPIALNEDDSDVASGRRLAGLLPELDLGVLDEPGLTPGLAKGVLGQAWGAVGVSYHFCTFALSQGVPAISVHHGSYYSQKGQGLSRFWGDDRLSIPLGSGGPGYDRALSVLGDGAFREALRDRAAEAAESWKTTLGDQLRDAFAPAQPAVTPPAASQPV